MFKSTINLVIQEPYLSSVSWQKLHPFLQAPLMKIKKIFRKCLTWFKRSLNVLAFWLMGTEINSKRRCAAAWRLHKHTTAPSANVNMLAFKGWTFKWESRTAKVIYDESQNANSTPSLSAIPTARSNGRPYVCLITNKINLLANVWKNDVHFTLL